MAGDSLLSVYFQGGADRVHALRDKNPRGLLSDSIGVALGYLLASGSSLAGRAALTALTACL